MFFIGNNRRLIPNARDVIFTNPRYLPSTFEGNERALGTNEAKLTQDLEEVLVQPHGAAEEVVGPVDLPVRHRDLPGTQGIVRGGHLHQVDQHRWKRAQEVSTTTSVHPKLTPDATYFLATSLTRD